MLLGGALTSSFSWSWIFFINVPVGALVLALSPRLLRESRRGLSTHRHFDLPGAASITGGLMLLVYAMTRAVKHGWGTTGTIGLLAASAALVAAFVAIEVRSRPRCCPWGCSGSRTLTGSNLAGLLLGAAGSQVLPADAVHAAGAALLRAANRRRLRRPHPRGDRIRERRAAARPEGRHPARAAVGLRWWSTGLVLYARLPVHGHYFCTCSRLPPRRRGEWRFGFVPLTIGALAGVRPSDAGVAAGLVNTGQQIGGAIGVAGGDHRRGDRDEPLPQRPSGRRPTGGPALTHGFGVAFYALAAVAAAALGSALLVESKRALEMGG